MLAAVSKRLTKRCPVVIRMRMFSSTPGFKTEADLKSFLLKEGSSYYAKLTLTEKCSLLEQMSTLAIEQGSGSEETSKAKDDVMTAFRLEIAKNVLLSSRALSQQQEE